MGGWVLFLSCVFNAALVYQTLQDLSKSIMPIFVDVDLRAFTKHVYPQSATLMICFILV